jgi:hypothetical protein
VAAVRHHDVPGTGLTGKRITAEAKKGCCMLRRMRARSTRS